MDRPFEVEHKHMFSDFGIALRRRNMLDLALEFHKRANDLAPDDEHISFNMARVLFEDGRATEARRYLDKAITMAPGFKDAILFEEFIQRSY